MRLMNAGRTLAVAAAAAGGAVAVVRRRRGRGTEQGGTSVSEPGRWHVVTIGRPRAELLPDGKLPPPLDSLGEGFEVRSADAPGGRGTEVSARRAAPSRSSAVRPLTEGVRALAGSSADQRIREVLREFKQLTETGEVLRTAGQPEGKRRPGGFPLALAGRRAAKEGRL